MKTTQFLFLLFVVFQFQTVHALSSEEYLIQKKIEAGLQGDDSFNYPDYYKVKEDPRLQNVNLLSFEHIQSLLIIVKCSLELGLRTAPMALAWIRAGKSWFVIRALQSVTARMVAQSLQVIGMILILENILFRLRTFK